MTSTFVESETPNHRDLLAQVHEGEGEQFAELCGVYAARLLRQSTALCGDATLAEDLAQDVFLEAWKNIRRYNGQCQFFTWLCAILLHRYRSLLRKKHPITFPILPGPDQARAQTMLDSLADPGPLPDQQSEFSDRAALVQGCIQKLPAKQSEIIYLRFYAGDSLEGIAAALGCSVGTVKSRLYHALVKLRTMKGLNTQFKEL